MEQTSAVSYPNVLALRYLRKTGQVAPKISTKAQRYINLGYQRLLTFESPTGGFNWWGNGARGNIVLTGLGIQQFHEMSKVHAVDRGIIDRSRRWLTRKQAADGSWKKERHLHGYNMQLGASKLRTTSYVLWSLLSTGDRGAAVARGIRYLRKHLADARGDLYTLALAANALALFAPKHKATVALLAALHKRRASRGGVVSWPTRGDTATYSRGKTAAVETTALVAMAMIHARRYPATVNAALAFLVQNKGAYGHWTSTQATILALKALLAASRNDTRDARLDVAVLVDGKRVGSERFRGDNADVLRLIDAGRVGPGAHRVELRARGKANVMYQIVGRYYRRWKKRRRRRRPLSIAVRYNRRRLKVDDTLRADVSVRYHLPRTTFMVIVDLGIPPGFQVVRSDLRALVKRGKVARFSLTGRQITLYLGQMRRGKPVRLRYRLKAKLPIRAKTPRSVAYEYYTPTSRAVQRPQLLVVSK